MALVYPDTYEIGMANQAISILCDIANRIDGVRAERVFAPWKDMSASMREAGVPLSTLESVTPVLDCDLVGVTLPHELTYTNVLEILDLAGIPLRSPDRDAAHPVVLGGGPCAYNPEPVAAFFDAFLLGEGEAALAEIVEVDRRSRAEGASRPERLEALSAVEGVYVPSLYGTGGSDGRTYVTPLEGAPSLVVKRALPDLQAVEPPRCPVVPYADVVHDRANIEILRGCTRGCRFCQAGMVYRPVRERTADGIVRAALATLACTGYEEVSLTSLSSADHSTIAEVTRRLKTRLAETDVSVSLPSLRADSFGLALASHLGRGKKTGLTFAPEAGSQRLRDVINKNVTEEHVLETTGRAFAAGWRRVKLYFMLGLPTETDEDLLAIGSLVERVLAAAREATPPEQRGSVRVSVSVSTFVPKPHTPFQWEPQLTVDETVRRQGVVRDAVPRKGIDLSWHDAAATSVEGALARGDRRLADVIEDAWRHGARFDAWTEEFEPSVWRAALDRAGLSEGETSGERDRGRPLAWSHLSCGVTDDYLLAERERAVRGEPTPDCAIDGCTDCGVCPDLGLDIVLAGDRHG
jgi:radical SAM family uncharacterized protein